MKNLNFFLRANTLVGRIFVLAALAVFMFAATASAQQPVLPLDFESGTANYTFTDFDGGQATKVANPVSGGINTSANVGKMVKNAGQVWGGSWIALASPIDFSTNKTFKVKVYMPRVGAKLLLKVENMTNGGINFEREVAGTVANAWEELTFDYSAINTANEYQKLVFIFDLGTMGTGTADFTYYFDDIKLVSAPPPPVDTTQMNLPVTFDIPWVNYGLAGFGGAENSTIINSPDVPANKIAKVVKSATAELWAGTTITAVTGGVQTGFATKVPFSETEKRMNVKVYSPHAPIQVRLKVEDYSDPTKSCETEATVTVANQWQWLVFDFANQASGTAPLNLAFNYNKASIFFNFGVTGATAGEKTYYFDELAFGITPVPVELTSFTASVTDGGVVLNWSTATEVNNRGFEIEKSENGNWNVIGYVEGNGTVTSTRNYTFTDVTAPGKYSYRLKQIDFDGSFTYSNAVETEFMPSEFSLGQNYPNPFNPETKISFTLPVQENVTIKIFDLTGKEVKTLVNGKMEAGKHSLTLNAEGLSSGVYFYQMTAGSFTSVKKLSVLK
ncbi:MAG: T9SS type A sorting domain-containing protein [Ignavibacteriaceae bacterium]|nr:T9SS type A sorting domain-containing protein [Ignavibacteriaceae bacterium]